MMMAKASTKKSDDTLGFTSANYWLFAIGIIIIIIGFITLKMGSITLAPILLVFGYCVMIPIAIMYRAEKDGDNSKGKTSD